MVQCGCICPFSYAAANFFRTPYIKLSRRGTGLDLSCYCYSLSHKTVNARENFWNVYCFATNQMRDETAEDNRQPQQGSVTT